jgi:8-oxo-dGTP pyrophosphatase MutT (NUDIX family)
VLVLLCERDGALEFPLTVRATTVQTHKGQISLPGGAREPGDRSFEETALRETSEELGIQTKGVEILGALSRLFIPHSGFCVHPFVGFSKRQLRWRPDPAEVAQAFDAPLDRLLDPATVHEEVYLWDGQRFAVPAYHFGEHRVWGATAMILAELVAILRGSTTLPGESDRQEGEP